jgi:serine/threonine-protein phosphatase 2A regulatory subunit A
MGKLVNDEQGPPLSDHEQSLIHRLLPLIVATIDDRSWRVRWTAAAKFADVIKAYNPIPGAMDILIPAYEKLLQDPEAEVRTAATFNLAAVAKGCESKIMAIAAAEGLDDMAASNFSGEKITAAEQLVKRVTSLTEDDSEHVRGALAMVATELAPILGKDATITHLVPPILLLLRDAASEVRLNLISSLESLNKVIGVDLLSQSLLPAIVDLAQDGKWRYVFGSSFIISRVDFRNLAVAHMKLLQLFRVHFVHLGFDWQSLSKPPCWRSNWAKTFSPTNYLPFVSTGWAMTLPRFEKPPRRTSRS